MGNFLRRVFSNFYFWLFRKNRISVSLCGLNFAGKSSLAKTLAMEKIIEDEYVSTIGVQVKVFKKEGCQIHVAKKCLERKKCEALVFMVDSADRRRINESVGEFSQLVPICKNLQIPILLISNKIDLKNHFEIEEIASLFQVNDDFGNHPILVTEISVLKSTNVEQVIKWLVQQAKHISKKIKKKEKMDNEQELVEFSS